MIRALHAAVQGLETRGRPGPRICLASSVGGHFHDLLQLRPLYERYDHFYVVNEQMLAPPEIASRLVHMTHVEREWRQVLNVFEAGRILRRYRPDVILSTGSSPAVSFGVAALAWRIPLIYIEPSCAVRRPTLAGRLVYRLHLARLFLYQWPGLREYYPRAIYGGLVF